MLAGTRQIKRSRKDRRELSRMVMLEQKYSTLNAEVLNGIMAYLKYLYTKGEISDKTYEVLASQALSTFIENAISLRVERMLYEVDKTLKETAEEVLLKTLES